MEILRTLEEMKNWIMHIVDWKSNALKIYAVHVHTTIHASYYHGQIHVSSPFQKRGMPSKTVVLPSIQQIWKNISSGMPMLNVGALWIFK